jgi:hypothetical protein
MYKILLEILEEKRVLGTVPGLEERKVRTTFSPSFRR